MSIVGGLDIHRKQLTFDWVDEQNGKWERGRIAPADREHLASWLTRFDPAVAGPVAFAMEGCTGWRYIAEEMAKAGVDAHLAEPADTSAWPGPASLRAGRAGPKAARPGVTRRCQCRAYARMTVSVTVFPLVSVAETRSEVKPVPRGCLTETVRLLPEPRTSARCQVLPSS